MSMIILGLVGFYGISIIVGYLMPNLVFTYILNIYDLETYFLDISFKPTWASIAMYPSQFNQTSLICLLS